MAGSTPPNEPDRSGPEPDPNKDVPHPHSPRARSEAPIETLEVGFEQWLTRTVTAVLFAAGAVEWWNGTDGTFWFVGAAVLFTVGEVVPGLFRPLMPVWRPIALVLWALVRPFLNLVTAVVPEEYFRPQPPLRPLSGEEINAAIDEGERKDGAGASSDDASPQDPSPEDPAPEDPQPPKPNHRPGEPDR